MKSILRLTNQERAQLFNATAQELGMDAVMVEKDFWVCWTLRELFALPGIGDHIIFKGGTSLSKVWRAIERFSEDIDVSLSRAWLGFSGDHDPESSGTRKQRAKQLENLSAACATKIRDELLPLLRKRAYAELGDVGWNLTISDEDPQTILFLYPSAITESTMMYIPRVVKIEGGARSDNWPAEEKIIRPYVAEVYAERITDANVTVKALSIERTFWEKATILHSEVHRPVEKEIPPRYSRHYSDLAVLAGLESGQQALKRDDLRARVVAHKRVFFPAVWTSMDTAVPGQFKLIPSPERLAALERDYQDMQQMFFRAPLTWSEIVARLRELERTINAKS